MHCAKPVPGGGRGCPAAYYQKAQALYTGDFLPRLSSEPWVVPISAYYHNLYIRTVLESIPLLDERQRYEELVALCRSAIALEPYQEALYQHLMRGLLTLGRQAEAAQVYEDMSQLLLSNFGIMPSEESRTLYREAMAHREPSRHSRRHRTGTTAGGFRARGRFGVRLRFL